MTDKGRDSNGSRTTTMIDVTALDGLVNVNSLFTVAAFLGLSLAMPGQKSLENRDGCNAGEEVDRHIVLWEVVSFSAFLFSSLIAQGLKLALVIINSDDLEEFRRASIGCFLLKVGLVFSAAGSLLGCMSLAGSMVLVVEVKLGLVSCRGWHTLVAIAVLLSLVPCGLLAYFCTLWHALCFSNTSDNKPLSGNC